MKSVITPHPIVNAAPQNPQAANNPYPAPIARTSRAVAVILPAASSAFGQVQPSQITIAQPGSNFYVISASNPLTISATSGSATSAPNPFGVGQGQEVAAGFHNLIVSNPNPFPVVGLVWVGYDKFINNQLITVSTSYLQVAYPTQPNPSFAGSIINIPDLSGQTFLDINGKKWGALQRVAILVFNTSTGTTLTLQLSQTGSGSGTANCIGVIQGGQPIRFDVSGNYSISLGGAAVPAIVSEIYQAFPSN